MGREHKRGESLLQMDAVLRNAYTEHDLGPAFKSISQIPGYFGIAKGHVGFGEIEFQIYV